MVFATPVSWAMICWVRSATRAASSVAADRDRMPARHVGRARGDHVAQEPHRGVDREAPLLLGDVLLEDVRLDGPAEAIRRYALPLRCNDVEGHHDRGRRVDRHRHRHVAEVDPAEQVLHVVERVDGNWRIVHSRPRYMLGYTPRVNGYSPGSPMLASASGGRSDSVYSARIGSPESVVNGR